MRHLFKRKDIRSWIMYDWANSAFATTVMATVLPIFYLDVAAKNLPSNLATSYWGYTQAFAMIFAAFMSPLLGAIADFSNSKKAFLKFFCLIGVLGTSLLFLVKEGNYIYASIFFIIASIGFSGSNIFYDSFLNIICDKSEMDIVSSVGYAFGYLGGGILLSINLLMISFPSFFNISDSVLASRICFLTVGVWWLLFSIPILKNIKEPKKNTRPLSSYKTGILGFRRVKKTFKNIRSYKEVYKFLIAFWLYNDGLGTIMRMATIYGREVGINQTDLIGALLLTQFIGIPFSILFGKIGERIGAKKGILLALLIYVAIVVKGFFMDSTLDFWILAIMVGFVQGGAQALSRSLYGKMIPSNKSAEFFGFFGVSSKFSGILGPFLFGFIGQVTGSSRLGIISIASFFIIGMLILYTVDVEKGQLEASASS